MGFVLRYNEGFISTIVDSSHRTAFPSFAGTSRQLSMIVYFLMEWMIAQPPVFPLSFRHLDGTEKRSRTFAACTQTYWDQPFY